MRKPPRYYVLITYQGCKVRKPAWTLAQAIRIAESAQSDALRPERAVVLRRGIVPECAFGWSSDDPSTATWDRNITIQREERTMEILRFLTMAEGYARLCRRNIETGHIYRVRELAHLAAYYARLYLDATFGI